MRHVTSESEKRLNSGSTVQKLASGTTINPAPLMASVSYARLTLHYDRGRYEHAVQLLPSLAESFARLGMDRERLKCQFLEALCFKNGSKIQEAHSKLSSMLSDPFLSREEGIHGLVLLNLGDLLASSGQTSAALPLYDEALALVRGSNQRFAAAHLKGLIAEALRAEGSLGAAVEAFRASIEEYAELGMETWVAYLRIVLSETLIALSRNREAEWEILAALPTIEEQKMIPEGVAALALLRESVARRDTNFSALREVRQHLSRK